MTTTTAPSRFRIGETDSRLTVGCTVVLATHEQRMATWRAWEKAARSADPRLAA